MAMLHLSLRSLNIHLPAFPLRQVPVRSMQHVLVTNKKRLVQGCKNAVAHSRRATEKVECANVFYLLYFMHMNAVWQSLYVCATKNCCALLTSTENFAPLVRLQDFDKSTFYYFTLWITHCVGWPGPSPRSCPLCTSQVTTLFEFYRCSKSMCTIALCMHCERWITVPLWRNYKMIGKSQSSQPWHSESVVTQMWVKPHAGAYLGTSVGPSQIKILCTSYYQYISFRNTVLSQKFQASFFLLLISC